jgi:hypothetical protein
MSYSYTTAEEDTVSASATLPAVLIANEEEEAKKTRRNYIITLNSFLQLEFPYGILSFHLIHLGQKACIYLSIDMSVGPLH